MSYPKDPSQGGPSQMPTVPPQQAMYPGAPPPYTPYAQPQQVQQQYAPPPQQAYPPYAYGQQAAPPAGYAYQPPQSNPGYPVQPGFGMGQQPHYVATAQFDSGARFDGIASQNIPPPPPGCAPNPAQMAAAQGGTVHTTQKSQNWLTGGKGGGMSFW